MPVVAQQNGKRMFKYKQQLFGARGGFIYIFDERDGTTSCTNCNEFLARAEALGLEASRCVFGDERDELTNAANDMEACAADAAAQGDPLDLDVQAYHARHKAKRSFQVGALPPAKPAKAKAGPLPPPPAQLLKGGKLLAAG